MLVLFETPAGLSLFKVSTAFLDYDLLNYISKSSLKLPDSKVS